MNQGSPSAGSPDHIIYISRMGEIIGDFKLITEGRNSALISDTNRISGKYPVFAEDGAVMEHCIVNTNEGPVYLGKKQSLWKAP